MSRLDDFKSHPRGPEAITASPAKAALLSEIRETFFQQELVEDEAAFAEGTFQSIRLDIMLRTLDTGLWTGRTVDPYYASAVTCVPISKAQRTWLERLAVKLLAFYGPRVIDRVRYEAKAGKVVRSMA